jgi:hypothetical protein
MFPEITGYKGSYLSSGLIHWEIQKLIGFWAVLETGTWVLVGRWRSLGHALSCPLHVSSLLPGCHELNSSALPCPSHYGRLQPLTLWAKTNPSSSRLVLLGIWLCSDKVSLAHWLISAVPGDFLSESSPTLQVDPQPPLPTCG